MYRPQVAGVGRSYGQGASQRWGDGNAQPYTKVVHTPSRAAMNLGGSLPSSASAMPVSLLDVYRPRTSTSVATLRPSARKLATTPFEPEGTIASPRPSGMSSPTSLQAGSQRVERALSVRNRRDLRMAATNSAGELPGHGSPAANSGQHTLTVSSANSARAPVLSADAKKRQGERLRDAATRGDVRGINDLLRQGARTNEADSYGDTALHKAAQYGHTLVIEVLLKELAEVDAIGWDGRTPLHECAIHGHLRCAEKLVAAGANFLVTDAQGVNARERALRNRKMDVVRLFDAQAVKADAQTAPPGVVAHKGAFATSVSVASSPVPLTPPASAESTPVSPQAPAPAAARRSYPPREWAAPKPITPAVSTASPEEKSEGEAHELHSRLQGQREDIMRHGRLSPTLAPTEVAADPVPMPLAPAEAPAVEPVVQPSSSLGAHSPPPQEQLPNETAESTDVVPGPSALLALPKQSDIPKQPLNKSAALYGTAEISDLAGLRNALEQERRDHQATKAAAERTERALQARIATLEKMLEQQCTTNTGAASSPPSAAISETGGLHGRSRVPLQKEQKLTDDQKAVAVSFLSAVPLFKDLSSEEQIQLASVVCLTEYDEGSLIIEQGAPGECCHFLYSGSARAEKDGSVVWSEYCTGDVFGESALLEDGPRVGSIRAVGRGGTKCFTLGREEFLRVVGRSGAILHDRPKAYEYAALDPPASEALPTAENSLRTTSTMLSAHRTPIARKPKAPASSTRAHPVVATEATENAHASTAADIAAPIMPEKDAIATEQSTQPKEEPQLESKRDQPKPSRKGKNKGSGKAPPPLPDSDEEVGTLHRRATRSEWGLQLQLHAAEVGELAQKVERNAASLDRQVKHEVAPELARYQELLELILAGKGTDADNIEMERLGASLDLESVV